MKKKILIILLTLLSVVLVGCKETKKVDVYISVYPIEYLVKTIAQDNLVVESIYPRGAEVHDYEPTPKQIVSISECQILFYIGLGLEPFITNGLNSTFKDLKTVELSNYLELVELDGTHSHGEENIKGEDKIYDSHVWLDPLAMIKMSEIVLEELIKVFPQYEEVFRENAKGLVDDLTLLNEEFLEVTSDENIISKTIMVDHDAYAYWTYRYGIKRIKLRNDNESNEVSTQEFLENIALAKENQIKYILSTKNETKSSLFDRYLQELDAEEVSIHHLGTITTQELKEGNNYLTIMRENLKVLQKVLPKNE